MKKIPYGMSNFRAMREEGYLYVDKTMYIEKIENLNSKYLFFIRPRRFGKSLFLSTLENYYDVNSEKDFEKLFGNLYIGKRPTKLRNSYMILKLNFSGLNTDNKDQLKESFLLSVKNSINALLNRYEGILENTEGIRKKIDQITDINAVIMTIINEVKKVGKKIYLIIDEYDHFANDIIAMGDSEFYREIVRVSGFVRDFYETLKIGTETVIDRIFITGISPIMLDDLTSGFNIALNVTMDLSLNEMLGFTEEEVVKILEEVGIEEKEREKSLEELKELYDGYLFSAEAEKRIYNPDMVLYYLDSIVRYKKPPRNLIDDNVKTDYGRLNRLTMNEENRALLERIIKEEGIVAEIVTKFSFDRMYDEEYFVSLLFYMGLLTIGMQEKTRLFLKIPNYVIKTIMWEYIETNLKKEYKINLDLNELRKTIEEMAYEGRIKPYIEYISQNVLKVLSNRDIINFDEKYIKVILITYLVNSKAYRPISERETEGGYIDIYLERDIRIPDIKYEWLIELKYVKKNEKDKVDKIKEEGIKQLKKYRESRGLKEREDVKQALIIFIGKDEYQVIE
ncbi:AAA-ATPase-like protein [Thermoanaerobacter mathranii subsp. mathranii str. A3]|uniref:AAA-ATPase-like protein n=1 Tax=Thermoanaerobacter mathranii subsp. mathranii (strain DSM 11426 / CCUG 53645 / CIP 108742 / A3) TaxID=583358 RepID=A0ABM5LP05_THEM3|nr:ATP-binding protein [Thermoanaerobacter mathranii]ADH60452.1 AAA-ATPase-like protein [Thermoanaerobacter mathranii subsp. mathranii str. A3]